MKSSLKKQFLTDNKISIITNTIIALKGFIVMPILIKFVGVNIYGSTILIQSMLQFVTGISSIGIGTKMKRYMPSVKNNEHKKNIFYEQFYPRVLIMIVIILLWYLASDLIDLLIFKNEIKYSFYIIPSFLLSYFLYVQGCDYFRYTSRIKEMSIMTSFSLCYISLFS